MIAAACGGSDSTDDADSSAVGDDDAVHIATYTGSAAQPAAAEILYLTTS